MKQWIARRLPSLLILTAAATVCAALSTLHWFLELFSHFTPYYVVAALALAAAFFALGRKRYASASLALAIVDVAMLSVNATPPSQPSQAALGKTLTVFHFNVGFRHTDLGRVVEHLLANAKRYDA